MYRTVDNSREWFLLHVDNYCWVPGGLVVVPGGVGGGVLLLGYAGLHAIGGLSLDSV